MWRCMIVSCDMMQPAHITCVMSGYSSGIKLIVINHPTWKLWCVFGECFGDSTKLVITASRSSSSSPCLCRTSNYQISSGRHIRAKPSTINTFTTQLTSKTFGRSILHLQAVLSTSLQKPLLLPRSALSSH